MTVRGAALEPLTIGGREFRWGERTYVMGVINVSEESFSGDGVTDVDQAVAQGLRFVEEGADILDVGGQSTRPSYSARLDSGLSGGRGQASTELSVEEEIRRIVPVIERLSSETETPISVDTYKGPVAQAAVLAGASLINDVWGLKADPTLASVAAKAGIPLIVMHNQQGTEYGDMIPDVLASLRWSLDRAVEAGVSWENTIVDPGFGFGKTVAHNLEVLRQLDRFRDLGRPLLLGTSRKSTIGRVLNLPVDQRLEGTAATVTLAIAQGVDIVRVHDVRAMVRVARMSDVIVRGIA